MKCPCSALCGLQAAFLVFLGNGDPVRGIGEDAYGNHAASAGLREGNRVRVRVCVHRVENLLFVYWRAPAQSIRFICDAYVRSDDRSICLGDC